MNDKFSGTDSSFNPIPFRVDYARVDDQLIGSDDSGLHCQLSDALTFYTQTHFIQSIGVTDLHAHFIDKSI